MINFFYVPVPSLGETGLSADGSFAYTKAPGRPVELYKLETSFGRSSLVLRISLSDQLKAATVDAVDIAFRLTADGTTHAAILTEDQSKILLIDLASGLLVARAEVEAGRTMSFAEKGTSLWVGADNGHLFMVRVDQDSSGMNCKTFGPHPLEIDIAKLHVVNPLGGQPCMLLTSDQGEVLRLTSPEGLIELTNMVDAKLKPLQLTGNTDGNVVSVLARSGEVCLSKEGYFSAINFDPKSDRFVSPFAGPLLGLAASSEHDVICFSAHTIAGLNTDHKGQQSAAFGQSVARDNDAPYVMSSYRLTPLANHERYITAVVQSPLTGSISALYQ